MGHYLILELIFTILKPYLLIVPFIIFVCLTFWKYRTKYVLAFSLLLFFSFNIWLNVLGFPTGNLSDTLLKVQFFAGFLFFLAKETILPIIFLLFLLLPDSIVSLLVDYLKKRLDFLFLKVLVYLYHLTEPDPFRVFFFIKKIKHLLKFILAFFITFIFSIYIPILFYQFPFGPFFPYKEAFTNAVVATAELMIDTGALRCFDYKYNGKEKVLFIWGKDYFFTEDDIFNVLNDVVREISSSDNKLEQKFLLKYRLNLFSLLEEKPPKNCLDIYISMIEAFKQSYLDLFAFASFVDFIDMERVSPLLKLAQKAKPLSGINALNLTDVSQNRTQKIISTMKRIVDP